MKTEQKHTSNTRQPNQKRQPFFREEGQGAFFSKNQQDHQSFFNSQDNGFIQPKLTVGQPGDRYEQEADAMADTVVNGNASNHLEGNPQLQSPIQRTENRGDVSAPILTKPQRKEEPQEEGKSPVEEVQPMLQMAGVPPGDGEPNLQTQGGAKTAGSDIESSLSSSKGSGAKLSPETQAEMGSAFGADFSGVRVHTDDFAVQMNKKLGAQAFTHGNDIYFNQGKYDPGSSSGKHLLAHELTHFTQQNKSSLSSRSSNQIIQRKEADYALFSEAELTNLNIESGQKLIVPEAGKLLEFQPAPNLIRKNIDAAVLNSQQTLEGVVLTHILRYQKNGLIRYELKEKKGKRKVKTALIKYYDKNWKVIDVALNWKESTSVPEQLQYHLRQKTAAKGLGDRLYSKGELKILRNKGLQEGLSLIQSSRPIKLPFDETLFARQGKKRKVDAYVRQTQKGLPLERVRFQWNGLLRHDIWMPGKAGKGKWVYKYYDRQGKQISASLGKTQNRKEIEGAWLYQKFEQEALSTDLRSIWKQSSPNDFMQKANVGVTKELEKAYHQMISKLDTLEVDEGLVKKLKQAREKLKTVEKKSEEEKALKKEIWQLRYFIQNFYEVKMQMELAVGYFELHKQIKGKYIEQLKSLELHDRAKKDRSRLRLWEHESNVVKKLSVVTAGKACNNISYYLYGKQIGEIPAEKSFSTYFIEEIRKGNISLEKGRLPEAPYWGAGTGKKREEWSMKSAKHAGKPFSHSKRLGELRVFHSSGVRVAISWQDTGGNGKPNHFHLIVKDENGDWRNMDHTSTRPERRGGYTNWDRVFGLYYRKGFVDAYLDNIDPQIATVVRNAIAGNMPAMVPKTEQYELAKFSELQEKTRIPFLTMKIPGQLGPVYDEEQYQFIRMSALERKGIDVAVFETSIHYKDVRPSVKVTHIIRYQQNGLIRYEMKEKKGRKKTKTTQISYFDKNWRRIEVVLNKKESTAAPEQLQYYLKQKTLEKAPNERLFTISELRVLNKHGVQKGLNRIRAKRSINLPFDEGLFPRWLKKRKKDAIARQSKKGQSPERVRFQWNGTLRHDVWIPGSAGEKGKWLATYYDAHGNKLDATIGTAKNRERAVGALLYQKLEMGMMNTDLRSIWKQSSPNDFMQKANVGVSIELEKAYHQMISKLDTLEVDEGLVKELKQAREKLNTVGKNSEEEKALKKEIWQLRYFIQNFYEVKMQLELAVGYFELHKQIKGKYIEQLKALELHGRAEKDRSRLRLWEHESNVVKKLSATTAGKACNNISYYLYGKILGEIPAETSFSDYFVEEIRKGNISLEKGRLPEAPYWGAGTGKMQKEWGMESVRHKGLPFSHPKRIEELRAFLSAGAKVAVSWQDTGGNGKPNHFHLIVKDRSGAWRNMDHTSRRPERRGGYTNWDRVFGLYYKSEKVKPFLEKMGETDKKQMKGTYRQLILF